jgi:holo-[acyl-carrier protein] synthase
MIVGIGTDIVDIRRVEKLIEKMGAENFANKILSEAELVLAAQRGNSAAHLAKRFAAKEAIAKALGVGIGKLGFKDIEISTDAKGAPRAEVKGQQNLKVHLSLADEAPYAVAYAIVESIS